MKPQNKLLVATGNKDKVRELEDILKIPIEIADIEIDEVQSMDVEYVSRRKAEEAFKKLQKPVVIDDVALYIKALNDFPGPLIKYLYQHVGWKKILELLKNEKNRKIVLMCAVSIHDGKKVHTFIGKVNGTLATKLRGNDGWGFDFVIIPDGETKTFAEMGEKKKNKISHRGKAFRKLKKFLDSNVKAKAI